MRPSPLLAASLWLSAAASVAAAAGAGGEATIPKPHNASADAEVSRLAGAVLDEADRSEHVAGGAERRSLSEQAMRDAEACLARDPRAGRCEYAHAIALGLAAREHPLHALGLIRQMLAGLARAAASDPDYDWAGPERVQAIVFLRAPGWPLGPGNHHAALEAARRAVARRPDYPGNWVTLAEAQRKLGRAEEARASLARASAAAERLPQASDRAQWKSEAERALAELR